MCGNGKSDVIWKTVFRTIFIVLFCLSAILAASSESLSAQDKNYIPFAVAQGQSRDGEIFSDHALPEDKSGWPYCAKFPKKCLLWTGIVLEEPEDEETCEDETEPAKNSDTDKTGNKDKGPVVKDTGEDKNDGGKTGDESENDGDEAMNAPPPENNKCKRKKENTKPIDEELIKKRSALEEKKMNERLATFDPVNYCELNPDRCIPADLPDDYVEPMIRFEPMDTVIAYCERNPDKCHWLEPEPEPGDDDEKPVETLPLKENIDTGRNQ